MQMTADFLHRLIYGVMNMGSSNKWQWIRAIRLEFISHPILNRRHLIEDIYKIAAWLFSFSASYRAIFNERNVFLWRRLQEKVAEWYMCFPAHFFQLVQSGRLFTIFPGIEPFRHFGCWLFFVDILQNLIDNCRMYGNRNTCHGICLLSLVFLYGITLCEVLP